jgi:hypothetical protein
MVDLISRAGYKWVTDYVSIPRFEQLSKGPIPDDFPKLPEYRVDYARKLHEAGINILVRLDAPPWGYKLQTPPTEQQCEVVRRYVQATVAQLGPWVGWWQFYNEPNIGGAKPQAMPDAYVSWFKVVADAVRSEQPDAVVLAPGTAMLQCMAQRPYPWIERYMQAGGLDGVNVFSFHPYRQPYIAENLPEHASEFHPWTIYKSYYNQIAQLRQMIRQYNHGKDLPLASTEDGEPNFIDATGQQPISFIVGAKYELRRSLLDNYVGVYPRTHFCFYRNMPDMFYESEASFNMVTGHMEKKPIYYAVQNLHAVLDSTYKPVTDMPVTMVMKDAKEQSALRVIRSVEDEPGMHADAFEVYVQTYRKQHATFDELLVFYWASEQSDDMHKRHQATLTLGEGKWEGPLEIDMMAMPAPRASGQMIELINPEFKNRRDPQVLTPRQVTGGQTQVDVEVRDYPMLVKFIVVHTQKGR